MSETATLNVRMDAETKKDFITFCDELGISASSLMNVFAKTVVRNKVVPFPLTSQKLSVSEKYARIFPSSDEELERMLIASANTPANQCFSAEEGTARIKEHMGW